MALECGLQAGSGAHTLCRKEKIFFFVFMSPKSGEQDKPPTHSVQPEGMLV